MKEPQVGLHLASMSDEAMRGTLVGIAVCAGTDAYYLPMDGMGFMLQTLEPLFTGQARIVTNDVKRLMVMLDVAPLKVPSVGLSLPVYDATMDLKISIQKLSQQPGTATPPKHVRH